MNVHPLFVLFLCGLHAHVFLSERGEGATPPGIAGVGGTTTTANYEEGGDSARGGG